MRAPRQPKHCLLALDTIDHLEMEISPHLLDSAPLTAANVAPHKVAVCGVSNRALKLFLGPVAKLPESPVRIAALIDPDPVRFEVCKHYFPQYEKVPCYAEHAFEAMLRDSAPDALYVSGIDSTHTGYILAGLKAGLDVVVEKPMVTTLEDGLRVLEAERNSKGKVHVAFNFRYAPLHGMIKQLLDQQRIGRPLQVNFEYYLDPFHGASYFRRWHRRQQYSGSLAVHKACHHFDLVNWWLGRAPRQVSAFGALNYYGPDSVHKPKQTAGHCSDCPSNPDCTYEQFFKTHLKPHATDSNSGFRDRREYRSYRPDACVFDPEIDIHDTYVANVRYEGGAMLSYSLNFSAPFEGYRLSINGTQGRLETQVFLHTQRLGISKPERQAIHIFDLFGGREELEVPVKTDGHLGGDAGLLQEIITVYQSRSDTTHLASAREGAYSVAVGDAVHRSIRDQCIVSIPLF